MATLKLALLGSCPLTLSIVRAAAADPAWEVSAIADVDPANRQHVEELHAVAPRATWESNWEELTASGRFDALLVAGASQTSDRELMLKRVAQDAPAAILVHPACEAILAYELDMIRRHSGCRLFPYFPGIEHPAVDHLRQHCSPDSTSSLGEIQQITWQRPIDEQDPQRLLDAVTRDMHVSRQLVGEIQQVSGLGNLDPDKGPLTLSVNLTSHDGKLVRWLSRTGSPETPAECSVETAKGAASLSIGETNGAWKLESPQLSESPSTFPSDDRPAEALRRLRRSLKGETEGPDWSDACRDMEIIDSLTVSLRRARTIQLHHAEHTEENSFKGVMAAGGCVLLLLGLVFLLGFAVVEGFRVPNQPTVDRSDGTASGRAADGNLEEAPTPERTTVLGLALRMWPVYPFAIFLVLQLFRLVFRDPSKTRRRPSHRRSPTDEPASGKPQAGG